MNGLILTPSTFSYTFKITVRGRQCNEILNNHTKMSKNCSDDTKKIRENPILPHQWSTAKFLRVLS